MPSDEQRGAAERRSNRSALYAMAACMAAGAFASFARMPVPWLLGPLLAMAVLGGLGAELDGPPGGRQAGQIVIGLAIGLYFAPPVVERIATYLPLMVAAGAGSILLGILVGPVFAWLADVDRTTAFFCTIPGGLAEMSNMAERHRADVLPVLLAQSIRVAVVVVLVPVGMTLWGASGVDPYVPPVVGVNVPGLVAMLAMATGAALAASRLNVTNPWLLGPMIVGIAFAVTESIPSGIPRPVSNAAQLLMGCALGARFRRDFLSRAHRVALAALASSLAILAASAGLGGLVAAATELRLPTALLATAPGGLPEISITAKVLQLGVPIVAAFHVVRILMILLLSGHVFRVARYLGRALRPSEAQEAGDD
ncbi:MAG TPA: AbrB family transcriptional regulator [Thermodesulfobacteriota bacterium]